MERAKRVQQGKYIWGKKQMSKADSLKKLVNQSIEDSQEKSRLAKLQAEQERISSLEREKKNIPIEFNKFIQSIEERARKGLTSCEFKLWHHSGPVKDFLFDYAIKENLKPSIESYPIYEVLDDSGWHPSSMACYVGQRAENYEYFIRVEW